MYELIWKIPEQTSKIYEGILGEIPKLIIREKISRNSWSQGILGGISEVLLKKVPEGIPENKS